MHAEYNLMFVCIYLVPPIVAGATPSSLTTGQQVKNITISWMVSASEFLVKL